jgi:hypothetical protein
MDGKDKEPGVRDLQSSKSVKITSNDRYIHYQRIFILIGHGAFFDNSFSFKP